MKQCAFFSFLLLCLLNDSGCSKKPEDQKPANDTVTSINRFEKEEQFDTDKWLLENRVPPEIRNALSKYDSQFQYFFDLNPFYLRGDFNGDGTPDIAILIEQVKTHKRGILVYHVDKSEIHIIGAGENLLRENPVPNEAPNDDFDWMHIWYVYGKKEVRRGVGEEKSLQLIGEAIYAEKAEAASGLIYWNGKGYYLYQQGD